MSTLFRLVLALIVLVSLTSAPFCVDTQCSTEAESCCSLSDEEIHGVANAGKDDHPATENSDDNCASCSHCSISVIISSMVAEEQVITSPLTTKIILEHTSSGWVSLPERPPSQA